MVSLLLHLTALLLISRTELPPKTRKHTGPSVTLTLLDTTDTHEPRDDNKTDRTVPIRSESPRVQSGPPAKTDSPATAVTRPLILELYDPPLNVIREHSQYKPVQETLRQQRWLNAPSIMHGEAPDVWQDNSAERLLGSDAPLGGKRLLTLKTKRSVDFMAKLTEACGRDVHSVQREEMERLALAGHDFQVLDIRMMLCQ